MNIALSCIYILPISVKLSHYVLCQLGNCLLFAYVTILAIISYIAAILAVCICLSTSAFVFQVNVCAGQSTCFCIFAGQGLILQVYTHKYLHVCKLLYVRIHLRCALSAREPRQPDMNLTHLQSR